MLTIKAFQAIEDKAACLRFMEGHARVLSDYGITNISTNNTTWKDNPSVYVITAENQDGVLIGGMRLHLTSEYDILPLEKAVAEQEPKVLDYVYAHPMGKVAEACGLWNVREASRLGLSILLARVVATISGLLGVRSMLMICASYTVRLTEQMGARMVETVGDKGIIYYAAINYQARFLENADVDNLSFAMEHDRNRMLDLRRNPVQVTVEQMARQKSIEVSYYLNVPDLRLSDTSQPVCSSVRLQQQMPHPRG